MAPSAVTEDYYLILGVAQDAGLELIVKSYRRLALELHPDRNNGKRDATEAFQRLGRAYETLKDESERRKYDIIYPSIRKTKVSAQSKPEQASHSDPKPQSKTPSEAAQIAALQKAKQDRAARWQTTKTSFESSMFELKRDIRRLENDIKGLVSIAAAEAAEIAQRNGWTAWLLSPVYKKVKDSEEVKEQKDRARQERRIEKDMKERRLQPLKATLASKEEELRIQQARYEVANMKDDQMIVQIQFVIWQREDRQRREKEEAERVRRAQQREQQEKRDREAAEAREKYLEEIQRQAEERFRRLRKTYAYDVPVPTVPLPHNRTSSCRHGGWWPKVQGRTECPRCDETWTYLLQCPGCKMKACPKCQAAVRPPWQRHQRPRPRIRTPSPDPDYDYYY